MNGERLLSRHQHALLVRLLLETRGDESRWIAVHGIENRTARALSDRKLAALATPPGGRGLCVRITPLGALTLRVQELIYWEPKEYTPDAHPPCRGCGRDDHAERCRDAATGARLAVSEALALRSWRDLDVCEACAVERERKPQRFSEPLAGWEEGMQRIARGRCPFCGYRMTSVHVDEFSGLTWGCFDGCNP